MANIDWTSMRWNGKLSGSVDLLYYNKENVDVVRPPYSWRDRNSSFFLQTRKWYVCDNYLLERLREISDEEWKITDMKIIWEDSCKKNNWYIYYYCEWEATNTKEVLIRRILDWCLEEIDLSKATLDVYIKEVAKLGRHWCVCSDDKLFVTTYVKWKWVYFLKDSTFNWVSVKTESPLPEWDVEVEDLMIIPQGFTWEFRWRWVDKKKTKWQRVVVEVSNWMREKEYDIWVRVRSNRLEIDWDTDVDDEDVLFDSSNEGIQINRKEWWVTRWYITDEWIIKKVEEYTNIMIWDYVVVYWTTNAEWSWFCWQVRTIIGKNKKWELMLNAPWLGFSDDLDENDEVRWTSVSYKVYHDFGEVVWFATYDWVEIITDPRSWRRAETLKMCDYHQWLSWAWCIISTTADVNRVYFLYENGYVRYWWVWMNKFFSMTEDAMYVWTDKTSIVTYRDMILAFWRRHIAVCLWDDTWAYAHAYNQSTSIWLKNRYAYGEYNWDMLFISNDNRLLALQFENNVWTHMLTFQDVWAYANPFIKAMLPTDEAYIWVDNNQLRIFINSKSDIDRDTGNSKTTILKYDTIFQVWTVDILKYFIINGCYEWAYYGDNVYYRDWYVDRHLLWDWRDEWWYTNYDREYQVNISAFLLENEENGMKNSDWALDLFHLAALHKLIVLLWIWRYSDELTKIKITERRGWRWREYEINCMENNDWVKLIWYAYNGEQLEEEFLKKKECVIDSLNDGSQQKRVRCKEWHKIQDPIYQMPWCEYRQDIPLWEHNVCINDEVYELAPTMPLTIQLWDQENYNSEIKVELISTNGDVINFWWFMAQLHMPTLWQYMWGDGEYQIKVDTGC